ncbi:hypothetical protein BaRGS_00029486 [Batillaria attramentaria]|uniref:Uncharacterized protein n=1 Tax=Batillaria attramentaria TaxID=370345 RepID=A0ABD0JWD6_9CAEN
MTKASERQVRTHEQVKNNHLQALFPFLADTNKPLSHLSSGNRKEASMQTLPVLHSTVTTDKNIQRQGRQALTGGRTRVGSGMGLCVSASQAASCKYRKVAEAGRPGRCPCNSSLPQTRCPWLQSPGGAGFVSGFLPCSNTSPQHCK